MDQLLETNNFFPGYEYLYIRRSPENYGVAQNPKSKNIKY